MSLDELEKQLKECQRALAYYRAKEKEETEIKWKLEEGEEYWARDTYGEITGSLRRKGFDDWKVRNVPVFRTKKECERYWNFKDEVRRVSHVFNKEDWEDIGTMKWYISIVDGTLMVSEMKCTNVYGAVYFETKDDAQYIVDNFEEELMEYWL